MSTPPRGWVPSWQGLIAALVLLDLVLVFPARPADLSGAAFLRVPLELPVLTLLLALAPFALKPLLRAAATVLLVLLVAIKAGNLAIEAAFARPFDPLSDIAIAGAAWHFVAGTLGVAGAVLASLLAVLLVAALAGALFRACRRLSTRRTERATAVGGTLLAVALLLTVTTERGGGAPSWQLARQQAMLLAEGIRDDARFRAEAAADPFRAVPANRLLAGLKEGGSAPDVLLVFFESYGRVALDSPLYDDSVAKALRRFAGSIEAAGYGARSAWIASPTFGGESWFAHSTFVSGVRIHDSRRYEKLLQSDRATLIGDFRRAGWRTVAVMPAMILPWPEGAYFGFDRVYRAPELEYRGPKWNWIETMPDQFTLAQFRRFEVDKAGGPEANKQDPGGQKTDRAPLMAEIGLVSSHQPWVPVPPLLPWDRLGDGSVFTDFVQHAETDQDVWKDPGRVRVYYGRTVDYVLQVLEQFIVAYPRDALFIIVGDHQPISLVSGDGAPRDVPIHIVARPAALAALQGWGWSTGMRPGADAPVWPMEAMRARLLDAFTPAGAEGAAPPAPAAP